MEKIIAALHEIGQINDKYGISTDNILQLQSEIENARVCTPVIGKFSSGKSALVNAVLGYSGKILKEDITPETMVPAEIVYSDTDEVRIIRNNGTYEAITVEAFRQFEADAATVQCVRLCLRNKFLSEIPDVMLVDMPGFDSGNEVHNKAIDNYLPQSMAYIVAFPVDDMIVRSSVGNILRELCHYDMPLCVVITKCDKKNDDFEVTFAKMRESLKKFVGDREIRFCTTSSHNGEIKKFKEFLVEIQEQSQEILVRKYVHVAVSIIENLENYLNARLKGSQMSESELDEQKEKLQKSLSELESRFSEEKRDFDINNH